MLTQAGALAVLDYDPTTGFLKWKNRPGDDRITNSWNAKHAGRRAGAAPDRAGYRKIKINRVLYAEHRVVWLLVSGSFPETEIDHINGVRDDNRIANLRQATRPQNIQNQKVRRDNVSSLKGVSWRQDMKKFHVRITVGGIRRTVGWYEKAEEAHAAYWKEAQACFGEYARSV